MANLIDLLTRNKTRKTMTSRTQVEDQAHHHHHHHHHPSSTRRLSSSFKKRTHQHFKRHSTILNPCSNKLGQIGSSRKLPPSNDPSYRKSWSFFSSNHHHQQQQQQQQQTIQPSNRSQLKPIDHHPTCRSINHSTTTHPLSSPTSSSSSSSSSSSQASSSSSSSSTGHPYSHRTISEESFTSAEEGDQSIWDHHPIQTSSSSPPTPSSSIHPIKPKRNKSITFDHHPPSSHYSTHPPLHHHYSQTTPHPLPSIPSSASHPQPTLSPPPHLRTIIITKTPPEFRIGRVFNPSELDLSQLNLHHDPLHPPPSSSHDSAIDHHHPTIPLKDPLQPSALELVPSAENADMLSRIAHPFNSLLSAAPNSTSCLLPIRRTPSSHPLAFRFQSGFLHRATSKSCLNPHHLTRPTDPIRSRSTSVSSSASSTYSSSSPRPRSTTIHSTRKSTSMTFSLPHHHPPQDHRHHHPAHHHHHSKKKASSHRSKDSIYHRLKKPSKIQIIVPHQPSNHPQRLPSTWRDSCSADRYQRFCQRFGSIEIKRQEVIWELCQTELSYIDSLKLIIRVFYEPLRTKLESSPSSSNPLIVPFEIIKSFHRLIDIINLHQQLDQSLLQNRRQSNPIKEEEEEEEVEVGLNHPISPHPPPVVILRISDTFQAFVDRLRIYQSYLTEFESINELIHDVTHDPKSRLGNFIRSQSKSEECNKMSLNSFLLKPIQRLMKYPLFFKQLCDLTPPSHPDHRASQTLWRTTDEIIREMQDLKVIEGQKKLIHPLDPRRSSHNLSIQSHPPPPPTPHKVSSSFTRS